MSNYEYYITPQEYDQARQNGISPGTLTIRIRRSAWPKTRALTTPPRQRRSVKNWVKLAEQNGIKPKTFYRRIERSWDPERAATQPLSNKKEIMLQNRKDNWVYPKDVIERAIENGISYELFTWRMRNGWTLEDASTVKKLSHREVGERAKKASFWSRV